VADFCLTWNGAMVDLPVYRQPASDSTAECHVENRVKPATGPVQRFAKSGRIRIIIDPDRNPGQVEQPLAQFELSPSFHLVRAANLAGPPVHWSPKSDSNTPQSGHRPGFFDNRLDLFPNAGAALARIHSSPPTMQNLSRIIAKNHREFRAANLDPEIQLFHARE
jgi:hypothetical protein